MRGRILTFYSTLLHTLIVRWVPALPLTLPRDLRGFLRENYMAYQGLPTLLSHLHQERIDYFIFWFCRRPSSSIGGQIKEDQSYIKLPLPFRLHSCIIPHSLNFCQLGLWCYSLTMLRRFLKTVKPMNKKRKNVNNICGSLLTQKPREPRSSQ